MGSQGELREGTLGYLGAVEHPANETGGTGEAGKAGRVELAGHQRLAFSWKKQRYRGTSRGLVRKCVGSGKDGAWAGVFEVDYFGGDAIDQERC